MHRREQLEAMTEVELDEIVYEMKGLEATEINNQGKDEQVSFILGEEQQKIVAIEVVCGESQVVQCPSDVQVIINNYDDLDDDILD